MISSRSAARLTDSTPPRQLGGSAAASHGQEMRGNERSVTSLVKVQLSDGGRRINQVFFIAFRSFTSLSSDVYFILTRPAAR